MTITKQQMDAWDGDVDHLRTQVDYYKQSCEKLQAKLDALMLEHCPNEMTQQQVNDWANHQVAAEAPTQSAPLTPKGMTDAVMDLAELLGNDPATAKQVDLKAWEHLMVYAPQSAVPLTTDKVQFLCRKHLWIHASSFEDAYFNGFRDAEKAHGISAQPPKGEAV